MTTPFEFVNSPDFKFRIMRNIVLGLPVVDSVSSDDYSRYSSIGGYIYSILLMGYAETPEKYDLDFNLSYGLIMLNCARENTTFEEFDYLSNQFELHLMTFYLTEDERYWCNHLESRLERRLYIINALRTNNVRKLFAMV